MKKIILFVFVLFITTLTNAQWSVQNSGTTNHLADIYFTNTTTGFAVGVNGTILRTTDAGQNWTQITSGTTSSLMSIRFFGTDRGYICGTEGTILRTSDAGITWTSLNRGTNDPLYSIFFVSTTTGYVCGSNGLVLKTTDSGANWNVKTSGTTNNLNSICFINSTVNGHAAGYNGTILRTSDAGNTWTTQSTIPTVNFNSICFASDASLAFAVGSNGLIKKTSNTGETWSTLTSGTSAILLDVKFYDLNTGYVVGTSGTILKTTNSGTSWVAQSSGTTKHLWAVFVLDANTAYACGSDGIILKSVTAAPANAGTISGETTVCQEETGLVYTLPYILNATTYHWTLPTGVTGTSTTNSITADFSNTAVSGNVTVYGSNIYGNGGSSSLAINVLEIPGDAGAISGATNVCQGQNSVTYSVPIVPLANSYFWILPTGASGSSSTNSIVVDFGSTAVSGDILVKGYNNCGDGGFSSLAITVNQTPVTPIISVSGTELTSNASSGNQWYNQNGIISGATGQNYQATETGDYYTVVTLNGCSSNMSNVINITTLDIDSYGSNNSIKVYPNPVFNELSVEIENGEKMVDYEFINIMGQIVKKGKISQKEVIQTSDLSNGVYMLKIIDKSNTQIIKIIKQ
ncbi:MAG: T9SS type A sorting domain-containing protein [Bacteroidales bacterium]|nr:T9SS type A sorting domain-containing protein [Bacteroidales bacterium]